ncbi:MAG TPA: DUF2235 domain-containing protein [Rickettsiales bacterium]|nr:DUF2235 domain-containing protein [Rickettsiales bacterium]
MANIIFCADGTWDTDLPDKKPLSNVAKLFNALEQSDAQITHYDDGIGADGNRVEKFMGGFFGVGLFEKIKNGYDYIAQHYNEGDRLYFFGFSRGAYTVRSLAGMIAACGLPDKSLITASTSSDVLSAYRSRNSAQLEAVRKQYGNREITIAMIGVWDTVGSLGIPGDIFEGFDTKIYGFLDTTLHPNVDAAYQALSVDERRKEFPPTLWNGPTRPGQKLRQTWFAGVHCDVGGGYADCGLSEIPLAWMMHRAKEEGVLFNADSFTSCTTLAEANALAPAHESWKKTWGAPRMRDIIDIITPDMTMANSVLIRTQKMPSYKPLNCEPIFAVTPYALKIEDVMG